MPVTPMLAELGSKADLNRPDMVFEPKIDGTRALLFKTGKEIKLVNRRGKNIAYRYPELNPGQAIRAGKCVLDGEIVVFDKEGKPDFYRLAEREHVEERFKIELRAKLYPATYVIFDVIRLEGADLTKKPLVERKKILKKIVKETSRVKLCFWTTEGKKLWAQVVKRKLEGVMAKAKDSPYLFKRSDFWLKIKNLRTLDCVVCGYTEGSGWRAPYFGALLCGIYYKGKLVYIGRVGTGWSQKELSRITPLLKKLEVKKSVLADFKPEEGLAVHWVRPKLVLEARFMNLSEDNIMRAPAFIRFRTDKVPGSCKLKERDLMYLR